MIANRSYTMSTQRSQSVYGGAGGQDTRIAQAGYKPAFGFNLAGGFDHNTGANEKITLQHLNDRLASYMKKVHSLQTENDRLEKQIREWYENRTVTSHDYSSYFATISELKDKILLATKTNTKIILDTDNAKLAADDFKTIYASELAMRMTVEADIAGLRRIYDDMNLANMSLEQEGESLKEDLVLLKRRQEEDLELMRSQIGGQVIVSVDAAPSADLNEAMTAIREHYDSVIAKNRKELEIWYKTKIAEVEQEVITHTEVLTTTHTEIKGLRNSLQKLEIELQTHISMKASQEGTLEETQFHYGNQLAGLQSTVASLEAQLSHIRGNISNTKLEYDELLDLKARLEMEIAEYRRLLDGEDRDSHSKRHVVKKVITVVETVVNGRVVDSTESVDVNETDS